MSIPMRADAVVERYFLEMRCKVLEVAASLDRIELAPEAEQIADDPRLAQLRAAIATLTDGKPDRARRVQMVFSDAYDPNWPRPNIGRS